MPGKAGPDVLGSVRETSPIVPDDLTVAEAAAALGTTPQTVRKLLRDGELSGRRQAWGKRFVWVPSRKGVSEFLSQHGRLDGRRRPRPKPPPLRLVPPPPPRPAPTPRLGRPRARAAVMVVVLGVPLLAAYAVTRILPGALWFGELGELDVFRGVAAAKAELWLLVGVPATPSIALNLVVALARAGVERTRAAMLGVVAASLVGGTAIASSASRHRQPFGVLDPMSGKDVGFFVFSLPFQLLASKLLLWLIVFAVASAALVYLARGELTLRPLRPSFPAQAHLAALAAAVLLVMAW